MKQIYWIATSCTLHCLISLGCANVNQSSSTAQPKQVGQSNQNAPVAQQPAPTPRPLSEKDIKRREEIHQMMLAGKYAHDGAGTLLHIGDMSSVPALLRALEDNPPMKNGLMICTTEHILQALRKITNHNAGITYEQWAAWWEQYQREKNVDAGGQPNNSFIRSAN